MSLESLLDWNTFLCDKYIEILQEHLSEENMDDPAACSHAMKAKIDWYKDQVDSYFVMARDSGRVHGSLKQIIQLFSTLVGVSLLNMCL